MQRCVTDCSHPPPPMWISTASRSPLSPPGVRSASSTRCVTIWNCTLLYRLTNDTKSNRPSCACRCSTERSVVPAVFSRWWKKSTEQLGRGCCTSATGVAVAGAGGGKADGGGESCAFGGGRDCGRRERGGVPCGAVLTGASTATSSSLPRCVPAGLSPAGTVREMLCNVDEGRSECCGAERRARKARRPASVQMPLQGQRGWLSRSLITRSRGCMCVPSEFQEKTRNRAVKNGPSVTQKRGLAFFRATELEALVSLSSGTTAQQTPRLPQTPTT